jgi:hypothetical protein
MPSVTTTQLSHTFRVKVATPSLRVMQIARSGLKHTTLDPILALNGLLVIQKLTLQPPFLQSFLFLHSFHRLHFHLGTLWFHIFGFLSFLCFFFFFFFFFLHAHFDFLPHFKKAMSSSLGSFSLNSLYSLSSYFPFLKGLDKVWHMFEIGRPYPLVLRRRITLHCALINYLFILLDFLAHNPTYLSNHFVPDLLVRLLP